MIFHTTSTSPEDFAKGFVKALKLAQDNGTKQALLVIPTLSNLEGGIIEEVLGKDCVKSFKKSRRAVFDDVDIHLETEKSMSGFSNGVAFAPFVSTAQLAKVLKDHRVTDTVYTPWSTIDLARHTAAHPTSVLL